MTYLGRTTVFAAASLAALAVAVPFATRPLARS